MAPYDGVSADIQVGLNTNYYLNLISFAILYYDYTLTFSMEVERFWTSRWCTWGSLLFFLNRYVSLLGHIPVVFEFFWATSNLTHKAHICTYLQSYHQYFAVVVQVIVGAVLILRTYALYDRRRSALILLVGTALLVFIFCCWAIYSSKRVTTPLQAQPYIGCRKILSVDGSKRLAAAWSGSLLFDIMVFVMTLYKSLTRRRGGGDHKLIVVLLRDGAFYFGVMALATLSVILTLLFAAVDIRGVSVVFTNVISSTLLSRLILRLRDPNLIRKERDPVSLKTGMTHQPTLSTFVPLDSIFPYEGYLGAGAPSPAGDTLVDLDGEESMKDQEMEIEVVSRHRSDSR